MHWYASISDLRILSTSTIIAEHYFSGLGASFFLPPSQSIHDINLLRQTASFMSLAECVEKFKRNIAIV
jgi:hypothetical protein